jgi:anaerobic selenocysteine-containing dehydrogenase
VYEHTESRQIEALRRLFPEPVIEINAGTATDLGIKEGDEIWVETPKFKYRVKSKAKLEPELHPNVVATLFGWWYPEKEGPEHGCFESNINTVIDNGPPFEPINGNYQARGIPCRIGKIAN